MKKLIKVGLLSASVALTGCYEMNSIETNHFQQLMRELRTNPVETAKRVAVYKGSVSGFEGRANKVESGLYMEWEKQFKSDYEKSRNKYRFTYGNQAHVIVSTAKVHNILSDGRYHLYEKGSNGGDWNMFNDPVVSVSFTPNPEHVGKVYHFMTVCSFTMGNFGLIRFDADLYGCHNTVLLSPEQYRAIKHTHGVSPNVY